MRYDSDVRWKSGREDARSFCLCWSWCRSVESRTRRDSVDRSLKVGLAAARGVSLSWLGRIDVTVD
jgi:hypothetical protein